MDSLELVRLCVRVIPNENVDMHGTLEEVLRAQPSVQLEQDPKPHPKGGYSLQLILADGSQEAVLLGLASAGLRPVF